MNELNEGNHVYLNVWGYETLDLIGRETQTQDTIISRIHNFIRLYQEYGSEYESVY